MTPAIAVRERPIIFSGSMVRAILDDRKTQTRRIVKQTPIASGLNWSLWYSNKIDGQLDGARFAKLHCPYGKPGDHLWVKETWRPYSWRDGGPVTIEYADGARRGETCADTVEYDHWLDRICWQCSDEYIKAGIEPDESGNFTCTAGEFSLKWRSPIHMPRGCSRITLEITDVRVERLTSITEDDAKAEGVSAWEFNPDQPLATRERAGDSPYRSGFAYLWDCINDKRATWKANPWTWVICFKRINGGAA
jgi:hypothetical protein